MTDHFAARVTLATNTLVYLYKMNDNFDSCSISIMDDDDWRLITTQVGGSNVYDINSQGIQQTFASSNSIVAARNSYTGAFIDIITFLF